MKLSGLRVLLALVLALSQVGAADPEAAVGVVRETLSAARKVADGEGTRDEKLESLRGVARGILDTREMGRRAGGESLAAQTPEKQAEYYELFDHVIIRL